MSLSGGFLNRRLSSGWLDRGLQSPTSRGWLNLGNRKKTTVHGDMGEFEPMVIGLAAGRSTGRRQSRNPPFVNISLVSARIFEIINNRAHTCRLATRDMLLLPYNQYWTDLGFRDIRNHLGKEETGCPCSVLYFRNIRSWILVSRAIVLSGSFGICKAIRVGAAYQLPHAGPCLQMIPNGP